MMKKWIWRGGNKRSNIVITEDYDVAASGISDDSRSSCNKNLVVAVVDDEEQYIKEVDRGDKR